VKKQMLMLNDVQRPTVSAAPLSRKCRRLRLASSIVK